MNKHFILGLSILLGSACAPRTPIEEALRLSGTNRPHLEQVLHHYSRHPADSLKYRAACFLIENMPGHGWYEGTELDAYRHWVDSVYAGWEYALRATLHDAFFRQPDGTDGLIWHEDIKNLDSCFLIAHIDSTFSRIAQRPWLKKFSFEQVCEHLLPYRVGDERPRLLFGLQDSLFEQITHGLGTKHALTRSASPSLFKLSPPYYGEQSVPLFYKGKEIRYEIAGCHPWNTARLWRSRLLLYPAAMDFNPAFSNRDGAHCWTILIPDTISENLSKGINAYAMGKVYRRTYSRHPRPTAAKGEYIPPLFKDPFHRDVTALYTRVQDVEITPTTSTASPHAYLCVFNQMQWTPVACAECHNGKFVFKDMGCQSVYLPVIYRNEEALPIAPPFILEHGTPPHFLQPDSLRSQPLRLTRKYPQKITIGGLNQSFRQAVLKASRTSDFRHPVQVGIFQEISEEQWSTAEVLTGKKYRYWRIRASRAFSFGECLLYTPEGDVVHPDTGREQTTAFDDDPISYAYSDSQGTWNFDMGRQVALGKVECLLRNDGNAVWSGHWYELLYHDGTGWCSLGIREARQRFVDFDDVPGNALLWLRDLTAGKEERIFTYTDDQMRFW